MNDLTDDTAPYMLTDEGLAEVDRLDHTDLVALPAVCTPEQDEREAG